MSLWSEIIKDYQQKIIPILVGVVIFVTLLIAILLTWDVPVEGAEIKTYTMPDGNWEINFNDSYNAEVDTTRAVIHHTATPIDTTVESIRNHHINVKGWDDIGYHFLVKEDGSVVEGRSMFKKGAHAKGRNNYVGIALIGMDEFSEIQIEGLVTLLQRLNITHIERHHEECPSEGIDVEAIQEYIDELRGEK